MEADKITFFALLFHIYMKMLKMFKEKIRFLPDGRHL